jgi:UTP:GlnB (protein PII) uridylyltransferase
LDNDSSHIKRQASQIAHDAKLINKHMIVSVVADKRDPKHFSINEIKGIIHGA